MVSWALLSAANPHKPTPQPLPILLSVLQGHSLVSLLLQLPKSCHLLVLLLCSQGQLPLVLGYELSPGLLSFPAV